MTSKAERLKAARDAADESHLSWVEAHRAWFRADRELKEAEKARDEAYRKVLAIAEEP